MSDITKNHAKREMEILKKTVPDAVILEFEKEILALCKKFLESGQSGGSAPFTASAISQAVKKLLLFDPICEITGDESEWFDVSEYCEMNSKQNKRCTALFRTPSGVAHYIDAIVWQGEEEYDNFTGTVYIDNENFEIISSSQNVIFPFTPKTFFIDVIYNPISEEKAIEKGISYSSKNENGTESYYYTVLKDPSQLDEVFEYYNKEEKA